MIMGSPLALFDKTRDAVRDWRPSHDGSRSTADAADGSTAAAGASTDQYITGAEETGTFLTDEPPTGGTPAHGSSNAGINALRANRADTTEDGPERRPS
jgi:hypothetical protein